MIPLGRVEKAFSRGGNRWCFVDPTDSSRCIKILRSDRSPAIKRSKKNIIGRMKPLDSYDDNVQEARVFHRIEALVGQEAFELIPWCYGFVDTDLGRGLASELIRDENGYISKSLKQCVWEDGYSAELQCAVNNFITRWGELGIPSRNLLLHNIVVQKNQTGIQRLVVIDGLGWPDLLPLAWWFQCLAQRKAARKAQRLEYAIRKLLSVKASEGDWGYHGWIEDEQRKIGSQDVKND